MEGTFIKDFKEPIMCKPASGLMYATTYVSNRTLHIVNGKFYTESQYKLHKLKKLLKKL